MASVAACFAWEVSLSEGWTEVSLSEGATSEGPQNDDSKLGAAPVIVAAPCSADEQAPMSDVAAAAKADAHVVATEETVAAARWASSEASPIAWAAKLSNPSPILNGVIILIWSDFTEASWVCWLIATSRCSTSWSSDCSTFA
eukprot:4700042-Prymnesium_polylepis.1